MPVEVAVLAKAPVAGYAKTRLAPQLGLVGAARLQERLIDRALATVAAARVGTIVLWCAPDDRHPVLRSLARRHGAAVRVQPPGDLGVRMLAAAQGGPTLVIGADCPALAPQHLRDAADVLSRGEDVVLIPAEDGGYVLIGLAAPQPALFAGVEWGSNRVMTQTRELMTAAGLRWSELPALWDLDRPEDLDRPLARELLEAVRGPFAGAEQ